VGEENEGRLALKARLIGGAARSALSGSGHKVAAVFQRSFYLANDAGAFVCIGPAGLGAGPLNLLCELQPAVDWPALGLRPGAAVACRDNLLRIGDLVAIAFGAARTWQAPIPRPGWRRLDLAAGLEALANVAATMPADDGFASLVPVLARGRLPSARAIGEPALLRLALPGIAALGEFLEHALRGTDRRAPPVAAEILLGLGPGLTPSGDDLIGGALIALSALGRRDVAVTLAAWALLLATPRTGAISLAHLRCAADGEGSAALHYAIVSLTTPGAPGLSESVAMLARIGHSSGWDMLAGAALAAAMLLRAG
jgi:hypothetical protein